MTEVREATIEAFLRELTDLTRKHRVCIAGCGCCGSPYLLDLDDQLIDGAYVSWGDNDIEWRVGQ